MNEGKLKYILPLVILIAGALITYYFVNHKLKAKKAEVTEKIANAEVMVVEKSHENAIVFANGTIMASKNIQLKPQVSGNIIKIGKNLIPGGFFKKGEIIAEVDKRDYEALAAAKKQAYASAKLAYEQEKARKSVAEKEWKILKENITDSDENKELALRLPQFESAKAGLDAAKSAYDKALLDVDRCSVKAPFNCTILDEFVDEGQLVNQQALIANLAGTDEFWVEISIPVDSLPFIDLPDKNGNNGSKVIIKNTLGDFQVQKEGKIIKLLSNLSQNGRMARILVSIKNPLLHEKSDTNLTLFIGSYISAEIIGKQIKDVTIIPRKALRDIDGMVSGSNFTDGFVYIVDDQNRLKYRKVEVEFRSENEVFVKNGLNVGDKLITNTIAIPVEGLKLNITNSKSF